MDNEKTVGTILKEAREAKGYSLADVERETSIRSRYLEAVENDEYDKTPGEVFVKGIIRNYGNFLGLDGMELVTQYKASAAGVAAEAARSNGIREVEKVRLNIQLKDKRDIGSGTGRFEMPKLPMKQLAAGVACVAVLVAGYFAIPAAIDYAKNLPKDEPKQVEQAKPESKPAVAADRVTVELEAEGSCWLEASADGKEIFAGMLQAKDKKAFEAKEKLVVKYGNIGAVKIRVNGELIDLKDEHGVAVKTYTPPKPAATDEKPQENAQEAASEPQPQAREEQPAAPQASAPAPEPAPAPEAAPAPVATAPQQEAASAAANEAQQPAASEAAPAAEAEKK